MALNVRNGPFMLTQISQDIQSNTDKISAFIVTMTFSQAHNLDRHYLHYTQTSIDIY